MRTNLDRQSCDAHGPPVNRDEDQPIAVEERQILHRPACDSAKIITSSRFRRTGTHCGVQAPSGGMNGIRGINRNRLQNSSPMSGNVALARRLSAIPRGMASSFIFVSHSEHASRIIRPRKNSNSFEGEFAFTIQGGVHMTAYAPQVPVTAVQGKRFILFDDDDDDDDDDDEL